MTAAATTVLLVDDDDGVRAILRHVLRAAGYQVILANSGADALRQLAEHARPVDIVMSDMMMPGMSGRDLAARVRADHPGVAVVLMSGYAADHLNEDDPAWKDTAFIQKPFDRHTILTVLGDLMAKRTAPTPQA